MLEVHFMAYHVAKGRDIMVFPRSQRGSVALIDLGPLHDPDYDLNCPLPDDWRLQAEEEGDAP